MGFSALHVAQHLQLSAVQVQLSPQLQLDTPQAPAWLTGFWIAGDIVNWCLKIQVKV